MQIGIIGTGRVGGTLARLWVEQGHHVAISNSRGPETLSDLVTELGPRARAVTPAEAAEFGDVVVVSVPLGHYLDVPTRGLIGKPVVDTNNYYPQRDGQISELDDGATTSSELLQRHLPGAHVVKAFNQIRWTNLGKDGVPAGTVGRRAIPIAGDDAKAKQVVAELIEQIGFDAVDTGSLGRGALFEPDTSLYVANVTADLIRDVLLRRN
jgi:8-hydroxy-5-deazaflavin:NADPH oxidoreductase